MENTGELLTLYYLNFHISFQGFIPLISIKEQLEDLIYSGESDL